jgi:hypothetical protein
MKPACMKKTRNAVTRTQTVLTGFTSSFAWCVTSCADTGVSIARRSVDREQHPIAPSIFPAGVTIGTVRPSARRRRMSSPSFLLSVPWRSMAPSCALP